MSWKTDRARVAALTRSRKADDPELIEARRNLNAARFAAYIEQHLATAPPLTDEQRRNLAALIAPVGGARRNG